jgi:large subunit ribosomal protein L17
MRHGKSFNHLGRTASHRKAMLSNMASSLILHKRISTTVAKAKALRKYVEPLITKSKTDSSHSRRVVFSYLQDKESIKILFDEISEKVNDRPGGYTRIIKTENRLGDNADMCIMELVDYNELLLADKEPAKAKTTRRSRRGKKTEAATEAVETVTDAVVVEEAEVVEAVAEVVEAEVEEKEEEVVELEASATEEISEEPKEEGSDPEVDNEEDSKKE